MLTADYVDGRTTRIRVVSLELIGPELVIRGDDIAVRIPFSEIKVDERLGRAKRRLRLPDGAICEVSDLPALDALLATAAHRDGWVDRAQRHRKFVVLCLVACLLLAVAGYQWLLPWAAARAAARMPPAIGNAVSAQAIRVLDGTVLLPTRIGAERQEMLSDSVEALRLPEGGTPKVNLMFRRSPQLGANAFALPDGTIVVLDDLITDIGDDRQVLAVLAHELGHVHGNDGLQLLLRSSVVGAALAFYIGDFSTLLTVAPATLVQVKYSQDLERHADDYGAAVLVHNGMSPALLADALATLTKSRKGMEPVPYLSSHPPTEERIRRLRAIDALPDRR